MTLRSILFVLFFAASTFAQSALQDHPTPITRNEIEATIKARDVGDARLTTHYYWFEGSQGDVFINWTSKNFAGDVDLFIQSGLRSLTRIVVYADFGEVETGRVIYLRKPERLLLRVQGRTPNDDAATYRLKFAGSFVAAAPNEKDVPSLPSVGESVTGAVRVNSVGTILPPPPKPVETKTEESVVPVSPSIPEKVESAEIDAEKKTDVTTVEVGEGKEAPKLEVVVEDPIKKADPPKTTTARRPPRKTGTTRTATAKKTEAHAENKSEPEAVTEVKADVAVAEVDKEPSTAGESKKEARNSEPAAPAKATAKVDPLANVQLVILFKDGSKIERPLPEVFRFSVDRGVLTVVAKDGRVGKYQMVNVAKVTIE